MCNLVTNAPTCLEIFIIRKIASNIFKYFSAMSNSLYRSYSLLEIFSKFEAVIKTNWWMKCIWNTQHVRSGMSCIDLEISGRCWYYALYQQMVKCATRNLWKLYQTSHGKCFRVLWIDWKKIILSFMWRMQRFRLV